MSKSRAPFTHEVHWRYGPVGPKGPRFPSGWHSGPHRKYRAAASAARGAHDLEMHYAGCQYRVVPLS